ncbi:nucleoside triphosphate hydrolase protein [Wolfiporia cocos MD-104 SS10]|uniref:Nucleoside triphosphate hydrolase protein n=1 Tax=Wolfiporia cocos (strain MD-104) TaxID=742152 RepID=A0A2H3JJ67_WOLCO|nr:nucleoside triphosphate hydrolase protein [Wolfiporia cocos MD-104 SS10]
MRLQSLVPHIPQNLIDVLSACGIKTDTDILFASGDVFSKLPPGTVSLQEFHSLVEHVAERAAAPSVCGDIMLAQQRDIRNEYMHGNILSGVPQLDEILGGLHPPRVVEISGDKGSGKSSFALQVVLRYLAANFDSGALWIDTGGDFSVERIPPILESIEGQAKPTVLERLQVALAFDIETVHDVLEQLRSDLSSDPRPLPTVHCVVIDAITPLLGPRLSAVSAQGHAIMTAFMRQLRALAEAFSITFLVRCRFLLSLTTALPFTRY